MVQLLTNLKIIDNSSAIRAKVIKTYNKKKASLGQVFLVSIQRNLKGSKIRKGNMLKGVLVRSKEKIKSLVNSTKWDINCMVLVKEAPKKIEWIPVGSRFKGPISTKLRIMEGMHKAVSVSKRSI